ncbi:MAG: integrase core domain-containing protein [Thermodesulfobacteriota bacterium]|nr:integrase core domain-containing protein [Thermodesulfobacteriota bacterium]
MRGEQYYRFTAIDDYTHMVLCRYIYRKELVNRLIKEASFPIRRTQTDEDTEFTNIYVSDPKCILKKPRVHMPDQICAFYTIRYKIIPPSTPQINGKVERSREEEFYRLVKVKYKDYKTLRDNFSDWITKYNWKRPHGGINMQTPILKLYKRLKNYNNSLFVFIEKIAA